MIAQLTNDGLLRITYGEDGTLTHEQMRERLPAKYKAFVPGAPEPDEYQVVNFSPYKIHQRCAEKLRVGRFLLAADAAHLCNPLYVRSFPACLSAHRHDPPVFLGLRFLLTYEY